MKSKAMSDAKRQRLEAELAGEHLREKLVEFIQSRKFEDLPEIYLKHFPRNINVEHILEWIKQKEQPNE